MRVFKHSLPPSCSFVPFSFLSSPLHKKHSTFQLTPCSLPFRSVPSASQLLPCTSSFLLCAPLYLGLCQFLASEAPIIRTILPCPALRIRVRRSCLIAASSLFCPLAIKGEERRNEEGIQRRRIRKRSAKTSSPSSPISSSSSSINNDGREYLSIYLFIYVYMSDVPFPLWLIIGNSAYLNARLIH